MRLRVQREDGKWETLTLVPPVEVRLGLNLNRISESSGVDHYFTSDGHYDGWGGAVPAGDDVAAIIERVQLSREIEGQ